MYLCSFGTWGMTRFYWGKFSIIRVESKETIYSRIVREPRWSQKRQFISELSVIRVFDQDFRKRQLPKFGKNILCGGSCLGPTTLPHEHPVYAGWNVKIWIQKAWIHTHEDDQMMIVHKHTCLPSGHEKGKTETHGDLGNLVHVWCKIEFLYIEVTSWLQRRPQKIIFKIHLWGGGGRAACKQHPPPFVAPRGGSHGR